jgi:hypothetical protein
MPASQASGSETERLWLITDHVLVLLVVWVFFLKKEIYSCLCLLFGMTLVGLFCWYRKAIQYDELRISMSISEPCRYGINMSKFFN